MDGCLWLDNWSILWVWKPPAEQGGEDTASESMHNAVISPSASHGAARSCGISAVQQQKPCWGLRNNLDALLSISAWALSRELPVHLRTRPPRKKKRKKKRRKLVRSLTNPAQFTVMQTRRGNCAIRFCLVWIINSLCVSQTQCNHLPLHGAASVCLFFFLLRCVF